MLKFKVGMILEAKPGHTFNLTGPDYLIEVVDIVKEKCLNDPGRYTYLTKWVRNRDMLPMYMCETLISLLGYEEITRLELLVKYGISRFL